MSSSANHKNNVVSAGGLMAVPIRFVVGLAMTAVSLMEWCTQWILCFRLMRISQRYYIKARVKGENG